MKKNLEKGFEGIIIIFLAISIISNLSRHATGLITGKLVTLFITYILFKV